MPKLQPTSRRPLPKPGAGEAQARLSSREEKGRPSPQAAKKRAPSKAQLRLSGDAETRQPPVRKIPWWVVPEHERALLPGGGTDLPGTSGYGSPPGPELQHAPAPQPQEGQGSHQPSELGTHSGPGRIPPPRAPMPIPIPAPYPAPAPMSAPPPPVNPVAIRINGGSAFPGATRTAYPTAPG